MKAAALVLLTPLFATPASSHCFSVWNYPTPQHCGGVYNRASHEWYVEIVPPIRDERSPQDIKDQAEHDAAVAAHHNEINFLMSLQPKEEGK